MEEKNKNEPPILYIKIDRESYTTSGAVFR